MAIKHFENFTLHMDYDYDTDSGRTYRNEQTVNFTDGIYDSITKFVTITIEAEESNPNSLYIYDAKKVLYKSGELLYKVEFFKRKDTHKFYVGDSKKLSIEMPASGRTLEFDFLDLTIPNSLPIISDLDKDLGDKNTPFTITYQVNDTDNDTLTVIEKLNGNILRTLNNAPKNENLTINFTNEQLYLLPLNQENKISIEVNDGKGGVSYRNYSFKRTNTPPIISNSDRDLGVINSIQEKYKITDVEGNIVSAVEKLDNTVIRTFNVDPDKEYVTTIDKDAWIRLKNGQHKYVIEATDFNNAKTIRIFTFTKKETKISFTLAKPFTTDIKAAKILITPSWEITGATAKVEACNNAFDVNPTWEDITKQVLINRHYNFTNTTKTADKWGINIRFTIDKDPTAVNDVCIKGFGGAFE